MSEVGYEATNQFLLQLFVALNDGLPSGYILYIIPQDIANVISLSVSLASIIYGVAEFSLHELYEYEPKLLNTVKFAFAFTLPNYITNITLSFSIILFFLTNYVNVIPYNISNSIGEDIQLETKLIDVLMILVLLVFTSKLLNAHLKVAVKDLIVRDANLLPSADSSHSIFKLLRKKHYMRCLIILMKTMSVNYLWINLILGIVINIFKLYRNDFDILECEKQFSLHSCQLLENRLNRFSYFFLFSLISAVVNVIYYAILCILYFIPSVSRIMINFMFDVLNENESDEMNTENKEEDVEAASLYPSEGKPTVCEDKVLKRRNSL